MLKKVLVTGGAGFIDSHLAEELARRDYYVVILDNFSTDKTENVDQLIRNRNVEFVQGSITDLPLLQKLSQTVEYVFHQAALVAVPRSIGEPLTTNEVNVKGILNILMAARENTAAKVVYASSSSVYADTPTLPSREDMPPNLLSPYAVTKLTGEYHCRVFQEIY